MWTHSLTIQISVTNKSYRQNDVIRAHGDLAAKKCCSATQYDPAPPIQEIATQLPTVEECTTHLRLLEEFVILQEIVKNCGTNHGITPELVWNMFITFAVARFSIWLDQSTEETMTETLPSLDILMVWHAFMLNPRQYARFRDARPEFRCGGEGVNWKVLVSDIL